MKSKVLFTASIAKHIIRFHLPYLEWFQNQGYETHVACEGDEDIPFTFKKWKIPFVRTPYSLGHIKAYQQLKTIINTENFEIIHCHTPMASVITRLAAKKARLNGTKVFYTAHGFHFFKGCATINWLTYYPIEKYLSNFTDVIILINNEDFNLVIQKKFNSQCFLIPGIGVDNKRFVRVSETEKNNLRDNYGYDKNNVILLYLAEFIERKNHRFLIETFEKNKKLFPDLKILLAGRGILQNEMKQLVIKKDLSEQIVFLGFRTDVSDLIALSDIGFSCSKQEGLGLNLVEEMFCGLPIIATQDRGHSEIVEHGQNGFLFQQNNSNQCIKYIQTLYENKILRKEMGEKAYVKSQLFSLENAKDEMIKIYKIFIK